MQHVHSIRELCDVDDTPFAFHVNPYFVRSGSNCHHRLKVGRHHATLNSIQFEAGVTFRVRLSTRAGGYRAPARPSR